MKRASLSGLRNLGGTAVLAGTAALSSVAMAFAAEMVVAGHSGARDRQAARGGALAQADQVAAGMQVFQQICAKCHGDAGEGGEGPALIGAGSAVSDYRTARRLFDFISSEMPGDDPGSLSPQQYYDAIAFVLSQNGWNAGGQPVNASTVEGIPLTQ